MDTSGDNDSTKRDLGGADGGPNPKEQKTEEKDEEVKYPGQFTMFGVLIFIATCMWAPQTGDALTRLLMCASGEIIRDASAKTRVYKPPPERKGYGRDPHGYLNYVEGEDGDWDETVVGLAHYARSRQMHSVCRSIGAKYSLGFFEVSKLEKDGYCWQTGFLQGCPDEFMPLVERLAAHIVKIPPTENSLRQLKTVVGSIRSVGKLMMEEGYESSTWWTPLVDSLKSVAGETVIVLPPRGISLPGSVYSGLQAYSSLMGQASPIPEGEALEELHINDLIRVRVGLDFYLPQTPDQFARSQPEPGFGVVISKSLDNLGEYDRILIQNTSASSSSILKWLKNSYDAPMPTVLSETYKFTRPKGGKKQNTRPHVQTAETMSYQTFLPLLQAVRRKHLAGLAAKPEISSRAKKARSL
jgi:hypothetical protein